MKDIIHILYSIPNHRFQLMKNGTPYFFARLHIKYIYIYKYIKNILACSKLSKPHKVFYLPFRSWGKVEIGSKMFFNFKIV